MRRLCPLVCALAFVVAACGNDGGMAGPPTTPDPTTSTSAAVATTTTVPSEDALLAGGERCSSPDGFSIAHPADWGAVSDCGQFGPTPIEEPDEGTDQRNGVVSAFVDRVPFDDVADPRPGERARAITTVDGLQAVRVEVEQDGEGLHPEGTEIVRWIIDLSIGPDDGDGTLFVDAVDVRREIPFDRAVMILDAMARSLGIAAGDQPEDDDVVARYEGGGTPFVAAAAPSASTPATCFRRVDADARASCVDEAELTGIALTELEGPAGPITVGITADDVWAVDLSTADATVSYLPVPYPGRDSRAFAVPIDPDALTAITLRAIDGSVMAEPEPADARRPV